MQGDYHHHHDCSHQAAYAHAAGGVLLPERDLSTFEDWAAEVEAKLQQWLINGPAQP